MAELTLIAIGVFLFVLGINAWETMPRTLATFFSHAPTSKSAVLTLGGAVLSIGGAAVAVVRRRAR